MRGWPYGLNGSVEPSLDLYYDIHQSFHSATLMHEVVAMCRQLKAAYGTNMSQSGQQG